MTDSCLARVATARHASATIENEAQLYGSLRRYPSEGILTPFKSQAQRGNFAQFLVERKTSNLIALMRTLDMLTEVGGVRNLRAGNTLISEQDITELMRMFWNAR